MFGINKKLKVHFIGIGGIGMSGIAEVLINLGYSVSGSDLNDSDNVKKLRDKGAEVFIGHKKENIDQVQVVVYSSAIDDTNPEVIKARELHLPIIKRAEMLAELMRLKYGIAVAGSHGKTTTTSFLATLLTKLEYQPTCVIGGIVKNLGGHAFNGSGDYLVAEADESDGSFLFLNPIMSVITNIDNDHLDYYKNAENIEAAFKEFANKVPFYGVVAINAHDEKSVKLLESMRRPYLTFGFDDGTALVEKIDYVISEVEYTEDGTSFKLSSKEDSAKAFISMTGKHNVLNAVGAMSIAHRLGANLTDICHYIGEFEGVSRRFEKLYDNKKMIVVDDYGHHPTELTATIETAKSRYPKKKVIAIFEPHRYSRTKEHWHEFIDCFEGVDKVYISKIYAASEEPIEYIDSEIMVKNINEKFGNSEYLENWDKMPEIFSEYKDENVVVLSMGAGSISRTTRAKLKLWESL